MPQPLNVMNTLAPDTEIPQINEEHLDVLVSLAEDEPKEFINDLLNSYTQAWPGLLEQIKTSSQSKNSESLKTAIHQLNGSSANIGLFRLCQLCRNIEDSLADQSFTDYDNCPQAIEEEYNSSLEKLKSYINNI